MCVNIYVYAMVTRYTRKTLAIIIGFRRFRYVKIINKVQFLRLRKIFDHWNLQTDMTPKSIDL